MAAFKKWRLLNEVDYINLSIADMNLFIEARIFREYKSAFADFLIYL